jgi:hypothetical protein
MRVLADIVTIINANPYYQNWTHIGFAFAFGIAIISALINIRAKEDMGLSKLTLSLKSQISSLFMKTVIDEAILLINMIDEHLPYSLSQAWSKNPTTSRFDYFCGQLKSLSLDPSQDDYSQEDKVKCTRDQYAGIIKDSFSGLLKDEVEKLVRIVSLGPRLNDTSYNSTGIRYGLEGETALKFDFIARKMASVERWHRNYIRSGIVWKLLLIITAIAAFVLIASDCFLNSTLGKIISTSSLSTMLISGILGFIVIGLFFCYENKLKNEFHKCEDDPGFEKAFAKWKGRQH